MSHPQTERRARKTAHRMTDIGPDAATPTPSPTMPTRTRRQGWTRGRRQRPPCRHFRNRPHRRPPRRREETGPRPCLAAIAGVAGVLAAGLIRDDLQAHLALARVGEQPPSSTPISRRVGGEAPVPALSAGGFLAAALRTGLATFTASGSPCAHRVVSFMPVPVGRRRAIVVLRGWRGRRADR
jgi:hypothetical protein